MTKFKSIFRKMMLALFIILLGIGLLFGTVGMLPHKSYTAALIIALVVLVAMYRGRSVLRTYAEQLNRVSPVKPALILAGACLILNGVWVLFFHPVQAADYRTFFRTAADLTNGIHPSLRAYIALFPHILGYSAFLSLFMRVFGQTLMTAVILNVLLTTVSGLIIYRLCRRWMDTASATTAFALWVICPSKLLYNAMSLSEPYYTFLLLLFFLIVSKLEQSERAGFGISALAGSVSGIALALVNTARPIGIIPIIALLLWLLFLCNGGELRSEGKKWLVLFIFLLAAYAVCGTLWEKYEEEQLEQKPASVPGYSIYVGFNRESQGSYSDMDMKLLQDRYYGEYLQNADAAQRSMLKDAEERIRENAGDIPAMLLRKLGTLLGNDEGGAYYSRERLSGTAYSLLCVISNLWYYIICFLAVFGSIRLWRDGKGQSILLLPLFSIGLILAQLLVEVSGRYHYALVPMLIILASYKLNGTEKAA